MDGGILSLADVQAAAGIIRGHVAVTPCTHSVALSELTGSTIFCKHDYLQRTGSFKERGARHALEKLGTEQRSRGVIAASAGNHAQGLSFHAQKMGIPATVVMPVTAPLMKVKNCQGFDARVILHGGSLSEARRKADELAASEGLLYINGFDHPDIIAGQGTMGLELLEQVPGLEAVVIPIGGGGLAAGLVLVLRDRFPKIALFGVEPARVASFSAALRAGKPVTVETKPTLADGLAVAQVGGNAFSITKTAFTRVITVTEQEIALAVLRLVELEKAVVEGAGAAPLAACLSGRLPELRGKVVALPLCGGNIDTNILGRVLERGLAYDGRLTRIAVTISDRPGGLARLAAIFAEEGASVLEIVHDRAFGSGDISSVTVLCVLETRDAAHAERVRQRLQEEHYEERTEG